MTLGEKIRFLRLEKGFTQEELAEQMNVSRSAIAKWESNGGIPDINNLKVLAQIFNKSIDELIDTEREYSLTDIKFGQNCAEENVLIEYIGNVCNIELSGWNDGAYEIVVIGADREFIYYQLKDKMKNKLGAISRKYITEIELIDSQANDSLICDYIDLKYFIGKRVTIEIAHKEGLIKGFFDFRNDDYQEVIIEKVSQNQIDLVFGGTINVAEITKIQEL